MDCGKRTLNICAALALTLANPARAQEVRMRSGDTLAFTARGEWRAVTIGGRQLTRAPGAPVVTVRDVTGPAPGTPVALLGSAEATEAGGVRMTLGDDALRLRATLELAPAKGAARFRLSVEDLAGRDRGLLVRVAVPVDATGWQWWDGMADHRTIESGRLYEKVRPLRGFAALPEWKDEPDLRMGIHSPEFCTVVSGPAGLSLAVPLDQPRLYRTAYDAGTRSLAITYDVALCPDTLPPSRAQFEFEIAGCDPAWGFRSALADYYRRHPTWFEKRFAGEGMWMAFTPLDRIDNVTEFGVGFQEGGASLAYDDRISVASLSYYTHAGLYANVPGHRRGVDPTPAHDRRVAAVESLLKRATGRDGLYAECGLHDASGQLTAEPGSVYGDVLAQFCPEPELGYGRWLLDTIDAAFENARKRGGELDGFYYDGLTTGINYRREHFRHADYPPSWDRAAARPYLYNYFSSVEWAARVAAKLHATGKLTMMNGAIGASPFCAPHLDIMGSETGLRIASGDFGFVRALCGRKTFATLLKANYAKIGPADIELFMKRCIAHGISPGFFDWPPSGLGPGGRYWDHPEYYERDRALFRKYMPLARRIAAAGWEPVTHTRATDPTLRVERFGSMERGRVYFTVLNDSPAPIRASLTLDAAALALPAGAPVVFDEVPARHVRVSRDGTALIVPLALEPSTLALLHVSRPGDFVAEHLALADAVFETGALQRTANEGRPARPMYWESDERRCMRDADALLLRNDDEPGTASVSQWAMLFQERPGPITIRARVQTLGQRAALALNALVCSVDARFTTRDRRVFPVAPTGGAWRDVEWTMEPTHPVRSIQLTLRLEGRGCRARIDNVSVRVADAPDVECVVDGGFDSWYEKLSAEQSMQIAPALDAARAATAAAARARSAPQLCAALLAAASAADRIAALGLANPARRELRDLNAAREHLAACAHPLTGVEGLALDIDAHARVAPGDTIIVRPHVSAPRGIVRHSTVALRGEGAPVHIDGRDPARVAVAIPPDVALGTRITLIADARVDLAGEGRLPLRERATLTVVPPWEADAQVENVDPANDSQIVRVQIVNNRTRTQEFGIEINPGADWTARVTPRTLQIAPGTHALTRCALAPGDGVRPGRHRMAVTVRSEDGSRSIPIELNHVPASSNRLKNPGFELGTGDPPEGWSRWGAGCALETRLGHTGARSLKVVAEAGADAGAAQSITLNQARVAPLIARGWCRTDAVAGAPRGCCLYVDVYYRDGTKLYGQRAVCELGTHDWQLCQARVETTKPVRSATLYTMLRGVTGTAWFDDLLLAEDTPAQTEAAGDGPTETRGARPARAGASVAVDKRSNAMNQPVRVVALGDSITNGAGVAEPETFREVTRRELTGRLGRPIDILNAGVNGDVAPLALARLHTDVIERKPAIVTVMFGGNEAGFYRPETKRFADTPRVDREQFKQALGTIVDRTRAAGARVVLMTCPPMTDRYAGMHLEAYRTRGINFLVEKYAQAMREVAQEKAVELIDVYNAFQQERARLEFFPDGLHPDARGHRVIADLLIECLARMLAPAGNDAPHPQRD